MPHVSVVIATRDRLHLLKNAVASVQAQTFKDLELVIVDDASSDGTDAWLRTHPDPRVRHVRSERHVERSSARNVGLAAASGAYVVFLDDDDRLSPRALELLVTAAVRYPDVIAVVGGYYFTDSQGNRRRARVPRRRSRRSHWRDALFGGHYLIGRALVRTDALHDLGGFDEKLTFAEDWELWLRLSRRGPVASIPDVVWEYSLAPRAISERGARSAMRQIMERHMLALDATELKIAQRMALVRDLNFEAWDALSALRPAVAIRRFGRAIASYPAVLSSPVIRPQLLRGLIKASVSLVIGRRGTRLGRRVASAVRRAAGRDAWPSRRMGPDDEQSVC